MIEFAAGFTAGFAVGGLLFFVAGLVVGEIMRGRCQPAASTPQPQPPATLPAPQPWPYQPPVIVLAGAPRTQVEQHSTALARK